MKTCQNGGRCYNREEMVDEKVICEILSKLPVRSLVRFKSVCKPWRFLVEKDPYLRDLHFIHSNTRPNFFAVLEKTDLRKALLVTANYLSSDEGREKTAAVLDIHNVREIDVPDTVSFFGPLNGLVGFYDPMKYCGIRLSNICTQETTPWIKSTFLTKFKPKDKFALRIADCQLGFDPVTKSHKVVCIFVATYSGICLSNVVTKDVFCEVLTVGDREWRILEDVPSCLISVTRNSVCLNGSVYYKTFRFMKSFLHDNDKIAVFDVVSEKFRVITIPNFILYRPRGVDIPAITPVNLLDMDGHLALIHRVEDHQVKLWFYDGDDYKSKNCWREDTFELPFAWDEDAWLTFHPVAGKDQIIMKSCQCYFDHKTDDGCFFSYHCYNWRKKTFTRLKINGIPFAIDHLFSHPKSDKFFMESLFRVN